MSKDIVHIWTDGSANNKTKQNGGCGIVMKYMQHQQEFTFGQFVNTTSARMEIRAVLEALKLITDKSKKLKIYSDNQYVVNSVMLEWALKWESENWIDRKSNFPGTKRINHDLWIQVLEEIRKYKPYHVELIWVRGHQNTGNFNDLADKLAGEAAKNTEIIRDLY